MIVRWVWIVTNNEKNVGIHSGLIVLQCSLHFKINYILHNQAELFFLFQNYIYLIHGVLNH